MAKFKKLQEKYINGDLTYNFGGFIPPVLFPDPTPPPSPSPTPTPSITPTNTPTPTITSTLTPTPTPSITPTISITPSITPTISITPSITSSPTPTPTITPTSTPSTIDPDAAAYLIDVSSSGGILTPTMSAATDTLFSQLKSTGIYSKLLAFYPVLGATSGSTALNGIRTNSQFDIDWQLVNNLVFDYSGVTGLGIPQTGGITNIVPNVDLTQGNRHMSFYSNGDNGTTNNGYELGGGTGNDNVIIVSYGQTTGYFAFGQHKTYSNTDQTGFYYTQISGATSPYDMLGYKNGVEVINTTSIDSYGNNVYLSVLGDNRGTIPSVNINEPSDKRMAWASYGDDLTSTQISQYESIINTFQTTLGRNAYT